MSALDQFRQALPHLQRADDATVIRYLHRNYAPQEDFGEFAQAFGYTPPAPPVDEPGFVRSAGDSALALGQGVVTGIKGLADLAGADNPVSQALGSANETMSGMLSAFRQNELQQRAKKIKEAEESGSTLNEVGAYLGGFAEAPLDTTLQAVGTMVPNIAAMMIPGVRESRIAALAAGGAVGAAQGTGFVKGGIYESVKSRAIEEGRSPEEAEALAVEAQRYGGKNSGQMALGAGLGAGAALGPVERIASGMARRTATQGMLKAPEKWLPRVALGSSAEAFPEGLQGGQQKLAENLAQDRAGFETDPMRGVLGSAALEAAAAAGLGGAVSMPKPAAKATKPRTPSLSETLQEIADAPTVDGAIKAAAKGLDLEPKDAKQRDGLAFEADPRFAAAPILRSGDQRAEPVFGNKQAADIYIGEQGLLGMYEPVQQGDRWTLQMTPQLAQAMKRSTALPVGDAQELAPDQTIVMPAEAGRGRSPAEIARQGREEIAAEQEAIRRRFPMPVGEATEILPTGDATEVEPIPVGDAAETIPTGEAFETLPVGEATEAIPTGEATELPKRIPTGTATELTPEVIDGDLLTGDGMPYGSKAGALVRAKREGLTPGNVVEIPGAGWVVRPVIEARPAGTRGTTAADVLPKETPREPVGNMAGTAGQPADGGAGRAPDAGGSSVAVGGMATDPGRGDQRVAGTPVAGGAEAAPAGDGGGADAALRAQAIEAYKRASEAKYPGRDTVRTAEMAADRLLPAIKSKNADALIGMNLGSADMNPASRAVFEAVTGVKLPKGRAASERAIDEWAGVTTEQREAKRLEKRQSSEADAAKREADRARKIAQRISVKNGDRTVDGAAWVDELRANGFTNIVRRGPKTYLANADGTGWPMPHKDIAEYARRVAAAPNVSNPTPAIDTPSERVEQAPAGGRVEDGRQTAGNRQVDKFYASVLARKSTVQLSSSGGRTLYSVEVTTRDRIAHQVNGRFPETDGFALRRKEDVTGNPLDSGWVLVRKQAQTSANTSANLAGVGNEQQINDTAAKLQARQDRKAKADRDEPTIELRKRLSVLRSLKECLG